MTKTATFQDGVEHERRELVPFINMLDELCDAILGPRTTTITRARRARLARERIALLKKVAAADMVLYPPPALPAGWRYGTSLPNDLHHDATAAFIRECIMNNVRAWHLWRTGEDGKLTYVGGYLTRESAMYAAEHPES